MAQRIQITLDDSGRIVIPESLQSKLGLTPGMTLVVERDDLGEVSLRPQPESSELVNKGGVLVARGEVVGDLSSAVKAVRESRLALFLRQVEK